MGEQHQHLAAAGVLVAAAPVAVWWGVGDLSEDRTGLDYMMRAPDVAPGVVTVSGLVATAAVVVALAVLGRAFYRLRVDRAWLATPVLLAAAGALVAFGGRILTAGVIGANIGGGLFVLFGLPIAGAWVVAAGANAWSVCRRRPRAH